LSDDIEAAQFDIGTTAIRLVRVGNVIQMVFSSPLEARYLTENWRKGINRQRRD
jgi:hypothetical protein